MKALVFSRSPTRYAATRTLSVVSSRFNASVSPLDFTTNFELPNRNLPYQQCKVLLSGICGSDISMLDSSSSRYFEDFTSFPFVPGHEIVALAPNDDGTKRRVVIEPGLSCIVREISPLCDYCSVGATDKCINTISGSLKSGIQTGYCHSTGGGWSENFIAHPSQIHDLPESISNEAALMIEPLACAMHGVLRAKPKADSEVAVIGAGTVGQMTLAALFTLAPEAKVSALARYSNQAELASSFGASILRSNDELRRTARRKSKGIMVANRVMGGFDTTFDCVGTNETLSHALEITRPGGTVILSGLPSPMRIDLTPLWHKQISIVGTYAYGSEIYEDKTIRTFELAIQRANSLGLERFVSTIYPLEDFEEAINHARNSGRRGATKIAFDPASKVSHTPRKAS